MYKKVKKFLFYLVELCSSKKQKDLIVNNIKEELETVQRAEHVMTFEEILRQKFNELEQEKDFYKSNLVEILSIYKSGDFEKLELKIQNSLYIIEENY